MERAKFKVGIDARVLEASPSGIGRYAEGLIKGLLAKQISGELEIILFCFKNSAKITEIIPEARVVGLPGSSYLPDVVNKFSPFWLNFILPRALIEESIDWLICPAHFCPIIPIRAKRAITVHDVAHQVTGYSKGFFYSLYIKIHLFLCLRFADIVFTVSEFSRVAILGAKLVRDSRRLFVTKNGVDKEFYPRKSDSICITRVLERYNIPPRYVLYLGRIETRKNISTILKVARKAWELDRDLKFVLVGQPGYSGVKPLMQEIEQLLNLNLIYITAIPQDDLYFVLSGASVFFFPSSYEGFGLPVLEALASGTPVVCSRAGALLEVVGDCALTREHMDADGFLDSIFSILESSELKADLIRRGLDRSKSFVWVEAASVVCTAMEGIDDF